MIYTVITVPTESLCSPLTFSDSDTLSSTRQFEQFKQQNVTEAIKDVKGLLKNVTTTTSKDVSAIADILQKVDVSEPTLPPSSVQDVLDVISAVSELPEEEDPITPKARANSSNRILQAVDNLGAALQLPEGKTNKRLVSGGFALEVWDISEQPEGSPTVIGVKSRARGDDDDVADGDIETQYAEKEIDYSDTEAGIYLPQDILKSYTSKESKPSVRLVMNVYKDTSLYSQAASASKGQEVSRVNRTLNSRVIAAQLLVDGKQVKDLRGNKVVTVFEPTRSIQPGEEDRYKISCEFWDYSANSGLGDWSPEGCEQSKTVQGRIVCECDHLTNFAVLLSYYEQSELEHKEALGYITLIGLIMSIIGIALSMLSFLCIKKLRKSRPQQVMFQLSIALLLSWIVFLAGIDRTSDHGSCIATAAILHYLILASFLWMLMEGMLQYLLFVKVMTSYFSRFWWKTGLLSWGLPAVPVIITLAIDPELYRGGEYYCWMGLQVLNYGFALPVALIVCANLAIFVLVSVSLWRRRNMSRHSTKKDNQTLVNLRASFMCFIILGLTWIFGFLAIEDARLVFQYLFCITASLQGFTIFLMTTARDPQVRQYWLQRVCCCLQRWIKIESVSTSSTSSRAGRKHGLLNQVLNRKPKISTTSLTSSTGIGSELGSFRRKPKISTTSMTSTPGTGSELNSSQRKRKISTTSKNSNKAIATTELGSFNTKVEVSTTTAATSELDSSNTKAELYTATANSATAATTELDSSNTKEEISTTTANSATAATTELDSSNTKEEISTTTANSATAATTELDSSNTKEEISTTTANSATAATSETDSSNTKQEITTTTTNSTTATTSDTDSSNTNFLSFL
ncbi:G-protein coupled receptor [Plakobranchus ocellatus]|uniref:G-protein coupled receptor n=1 Tax=Plakobranchus ocellatus TaxID=259542 RepID=A0AAV4C6L9_9GAST|nr:G-protein coupled receptor [Plakobranchus ocellatus]